MEWPEDCRHLLFNAAQDMMVAASEQLRPFILYKPSIFQDGNAWCALLGEDLQMGIAGFGDSPDEASRAFDAEWHAKISDQKQTMPPSSGARQ